MGVGITRAKAQAFEEKALGLVEPSLLLERPGKHESRLGGTDAELECLPRRGLGFGRMAEVAFRGGQVVPRDRVARSRHQLRPQAPGIRRAVAGHGG